MLSAVLQGLISGALVGGMYATVGIGLTLVFGVVRIVNFAHGSFLMAAAYCSWLLFDRFDIDPYLSALILVPGFFAIGIAYYWGLMRPMIGQSLLAQSLITIAVSYVMDNVALGLFSSQMRVVSVSYAVASFSVGPIDLPVTRLIAGAVGLCATTVMYLLLWRTGMGVAVRAAAADRPYKATAAQLFFRDPAVYYWLFLAMTLAVLALSLLIRNRRIGLYFLCIRESEPAAMGAGIDILRYKLLAIAISAALTALGGVLYAHYIRFLDPDSIFGWQVSLQMVIPAMLGGTQAILGPTVGAAIFVVLQETTRTLVDFAGAPLIIVGLVLIPVVLFLPAGVVPSIQRRVRRRRAVAQRGGLSVASGPAIPVTRTRAPLADVDVLLRVEGLSRRFGGVQAVNNVSLECRRGERLAVIGPNGAGKSTLFALLGGFVAPNTGQISLDGRRIHGLGANEICRLGLARTFQTAQPFRALTVLENVLASAYLHAATHAEAMRAAEEVLALFQLTGHSSEIAADLNIVDQKRLEVARAWASQPRLILLDEVGAGPTALELDQLVDMLIRLNTERGTTILFIEHMMSMVARLADRVIVLHHGEILAQGSMAEVCADPVVVEAYLGESALAA